MATDHVQTIEIPMTGSVSTQAYVARPSDPDGDDTEHPGVLFFMDAIGLRPRIAEMAQRIADWGYVVLAPNVFHREGRAEELAPEDDLREPGAREAFFERAMPRVQALTPDLVEQDIPIYLAALRGLDGVYEDTVAAVGYCMGARLAVRAAGLDPDVAAVGGFHGGGLVTEDERSPHRGIPRARAEFLFGHADHDRSMPPEAVEELRRVLDEAGLAGTSVVYAGAAHGYTMADTPMYDESATERHFIELEELLDRTL
jgi:carboxymethylenebutenolidase